MLQLIITGLRYTYHHLKFHVYIFFQLGSYLNPESLLWEKDRWER